jgi:DNA-binding winged helix-turn-helix (wHTH) protein/tetratricopeptide (TPR) repeat protein
LRFEFDECVLDASRQELWRDGELVRVEPQVLAVLEYLVTHHDRVVTKIELLDEVWGDRFVSESALTSRIKLARRACGDSGSEQRILRTVHSRGYRFVAQVTTTDDAPAPAASLPVAPVGSTRSSTTVFGRNRELAILHEAVADVATGQRRAVFVCGGVGTGTSTLLAEFLEQSEAVDGWLVARGRCIRTRSGVEPYFCLLDALNHLARSEPEVVASTLELAAPTWLGQMPALVDQDGLERLERRLLGSGTTRMLREGVEAFGTLARDRPLLLLLEDLHWADDCTLDVLDLLVQRTDACRLLLVGTGRPDTARLGSVFDPAAAAGRATILELGPLDRDAIAALTRDRLGGEPPDQLVEIVADRSGGVPLFAEEIVVSWLRNGQIDATDGVIRLLEPVDALEATIPPTLPPLIERELLGLADTERTVLEACAVAGDHLDAAQVAAALDQPIVDTEETLAALARRQGLVGAGGASSWPDGTISASYAFTQRLFRDVIYDQIPASRRALFHRRIATALERGHAGRTNELAVVLAEHFAEAGDTLRSVEYLRAAGELANARSAHAHAESFLTRALDALAQTVPSPERDAAELQVRMTLGPALVAAHGWFDPSVSDNYERALEICGEDDLGPEAAAARYGLATVSELQGRFERTESLLAPLLAPDADGHLALEAHELVACSAFHQGRFTHSLETAATVLDSWDEDAYSVLMARIAEHPASSCSSWSSLDLWALGRSDESLQLAERAVELGERNRYALSTAVQQRAMLHQLRNEPEACIEWAERCRQVGEEQDFPMRTIQADIYKGWAIAATGDPRSGVELIDRGVTRFRDAGATLNEAYYVGMYADALIRAGDPARACELLDLAAERTTSRTYFFEAELRRIRARAAVALDRLDDARHLLDESLAIAREQGATALALRTIADRCELEAQHGDASPWRRQLTELLAVYDGQDTVPDVERARQLAAIGPDQF